MTPQDWDEPPNHAMHRTKPAVSLRCGVSIDRELVVTCEATSAGFAAEREPLGSYYDVVAIWRGADPFVGAVPPYVVRWINVGLHAGVSFWPHSVGVTRGASR